jgi:hypothetical protein
VSEVQCGKCGRVLEESADTPHDLRKPCPNCGSPTRQFNVTVTAKLELSGSIAWEHIHQYYETNRKALAAAILITVVSLFLGQVVAGFWGLIVGCALSIVSFVVPPAYTKIIERTRG